MTTKTYCVLRLAVLIALLSNLGVALADPPHKPKPSEQKKESVGRSNDDDDENADRSRINIPSARPEDDNGDDGKGRVCDGLPTHAELRAVLRSIVPAPTPPTPPTANAGFNLNMWATIVNRDGVVCSVAFSGDDRGDQWPGSRVISAQKANTANAFSLPDLALSTANLYSAVQPGGTLYGLQHSNPVDPSIAYKGPSKRYGQHNDPMVGKKIGGVNIFGGGLALYNKNGELVGALGVSGDTSCTDHIVAWKIRHALKLDYVPAGVSPTKDDNIVHDIGLNSQGHPVSSSGWGHPVCDAFEGPIAAALPTTHPISKP